MKERILSGWNLQRWVYLILGLLLIVHAIGDKTWAGVLFGSYIAFIAIFRFGCTSGSCNYNGNIDKHELNKNAGNKVGFEEVKVK